MNRRRCPICGGIKSSVAKMCAACRTAVIHTNCHQRWFAISKMILSGRSMASVARQYGISRERMRQIVKHMVQIGLLPAVVKKVCTMCGVKLFVPVSRSHKHDRCTVCTKVKVVTCYMCGRTRTVSARLYGPLYRCASCYREQRKARVIQRGQQMMSMIQDGHSVRDIAKCYGVSICTVYKCLRAQGWQPKSRIHRGD